MSYSGVVYHCFHIIGDVRTNEQPGLVSMHTLFLREHNRIWEELRKINPHWTAEELFQTARKIVIGIMQNIVYTEWLPVVMGKDGITQYGLKTDRHVCLSFHFVLFCLLLTVNVLKFQTIHSILLGLNLAFYVVVS